jgi:type II secretory pathway pseudopilin PulG
LNTKLPKNHSRACGALMASRLPPERSAGMTVVEVMASLAILAIAILGLVGGMIVATTANGRASHRTQMAEFAQSRLERLVAASRKNVCYYDPVAGSVVSPGAVSCTAAMVSSGTFDPTAAPNTGGWMLDVLDRSDALLASNGVDQMAGPVVVIGDEGAIDEAATLATRSALTADWNAAGHGCASPIVNASRAILCREVHIETQNAAVTGNALNVYHVWVRVVRGGGIWSDGYVVLEEVIAQ